MKKFILSLFRHSLISIIFLTPFISVITSNSAENRGDSSEKNVIERTGKFRQAIEKLCGIHHVVSLPKGTGAKLGEIHLDWSYRHPEFGQNWASELCYLSVLARRILEAPEKPEIKFLQEKQRSLVNLTMLLIATALDNDVTSIKFEYAKQYPKLADAEANEKIARAVLRLYARGVTQAQCKQMTPETFPFD